MCDTSGCALILGLSLGSAHSLVLEGDGSVWAVGSNMFSQLGTDSGSNKVVRNFVEVVSGGAAAVAAGDEHSMVLMQDGSVWLSGTNTFGQIGDGSNTVTRRFVVVIPHNAKAVGAGAKHSLVVMRDGSVWATGYNGRGQLGDGSAISKNRFFLVIGTWDIALGNTLLGVRVEVNGLG